MLVDYDQVSGFLTTIGPELDVEEIAAFEESRSWLIAADDETELALSIDYDASEERLVIGAELGAPPPERAAQVHELLLDYNLGSLEHGGVRMARDALSGEIVQLHDLPLHHLDADRLRKTIAAFLQTAVAMRALVNAGFEADASSPAEPAATNGPAGSHIRV
ncbi:MAG: type III secretion system chaperone [Pseudomonadota bacterium]